MTLKRQLTVVVTVMLAVTMAAFAWLLVRTTRAELMKQLGDAAVGAAARDAPFPSNINPDESKSPPKGAAAVESVNSMDRGVNGGRRVARLLYDAKGELLNYEASGFSDAPDPIVNLPAMGSVEQRRMVNQLRIRRSDDGSIRYLVMTRAVRNGRIRFDAVSMESADRAVRRLGTIAILAGALATLGASVVTALTMRRTLRPVEEMVETSERIAAGDLTARVLEQKPGTEIGRLGGALNGMLATIERAISERDNKELELRHFIADASHELRTPITVVQGYSDLYRAGALADKSQLDKAMNRIDSQTARMSRLVQDLLLLANLERPNFITRTRTDVAALAAESVNEFALFANQYPTTLTSTGVAFADVDEQRIRQVLDNLLQNVREHTIVGTKVSVEVVSTADKVTIRVNNSGPGIDAEKCRYLFQRFWRADPTQGQALGASGLGLAITDSIVSAHGGTIDVRSNDLEGTTFTIVLPTQSLSGDSQNPAEDALNKL
jgi:two-component system, OmpR family, sensor kinase